jgi:alkylation response protein AidB-like acyl-CoA dehydrogenase
MENIVGSYSMTKGFVSQKSDIAIVELLQLLKSRSDTYYFLRYVDKVSGFITQDKLPDTLSLEGQMFDHKVEIRWKKRGDKYDVLWLGIEEPPKDFKSIAGSWQYNNRKALVYPETETRLPKGIKYRSDNVGQRYFRDACTNTIHFIALRIK